MLQLIVTPHFWLIIALSLSKIIIALIVALLLGTTFAYISMRYTFFYLLFNPLMLLLKAVPVASFIILLLVWFSSSSLPIIICFMMTLPIFYTTMYTAFLHINPQLVEMAQVFDLSTTTFIRYIILPEITPLFLSACQLAIGLGFKSAIACEIIALTTHTIGEQLYNAKIFLDTPTVFAWTIVIILLSFLLEKCCITFLRYGLNKLCEVPL